MESVRELIEDHAARGVFRFSPQPSDKIGSERYRIVWFRGQTMQLDVDSRHGRATLCGFLPPVSPRTKLDRELRAWLKSHESHERPAHRRRDPTQFKTVLRNADSVMRVSITSTEGNPVQATRKLLQLVNELYLEFLADASRYNWIVETFDLDPDSSRWP
ncbi:MAG: hypothetical protein AAB176_12215 [Pseudomonadota bacterium]|jgi:hypothetical protein